MNLAEHKEILLASIAAIDEKIGPMEASIQEARDERERYHSALMALDGSVAVAAPARRRGRPAAAAAPAKPRPPKGEVDEAAILAFARGVDGEGWFTTSEAATALGADVTATVLKSMEGIEFNGVNGRGSKYKLAA